MPIGSSAATLGSILAAAVAVIAAGFAFWQWRERRNRASDLSAADLVHYARQDARRFLGSTVMLLIAAGMVFGLRINPRNRLEGRLFGVVWIGVLALVCVLFALALLDWIAIRAYAGRHRRALIDERLAVIEAERRRLATPPNAGGPSSTPGPSD